MCCISQNRIKVVGGFEFANQLSLTIEPILSYPLGSMSLPRLLHVGKGGRSLQRQV